ncbi:hypothetical protein V7S43_008878 [Phytophthora oleae]|uniref:Mitochondrial Carrier (MC) Family n=1 Tax=Phytophthora oleae TaxID=2107226 RepID=A0ABD3FI55_9STRA
MIKEGQDARTFMKETLAVSLSGLVTLPTDLVTLRLQTQGCERVYKGVGDAFVRIAKEEGIRAFGKGGTSRLASSLLYTPLTNAFGGVSKKAVAMLHLQKIEDEEEMTPQHALEAVISALFVSTILTIPENITVKLQFQREALGQGVYRGPLDCMSKVFNREGATGLFRGWSSVLLRDVAIHPVLVGGFLATKPMVERRTRLPRRLSSCMVSPLQSA